MPNLRDKPDFPKMVQLPEDNIPQEVLQYLIDSNAWFRDFEQKTVPHLLIRIRSFKDAIPIDIAVRIIKEEILGES